MTKQKTPDIADLAQLSSALVGAVVEQEVQVLHLMQAEVEALTKGISLPQTPASEAETEASFDNMPI